MARFLNLLIHQGADFRQKTTVKVQNGSTLEPKNLAGYSGRAQIRKAYGDTSVLAEIAVTVDASISEILLHLGNALTSSIPSNCWSYEVPENFALMAFDELPPALQKRAYVWDLELFELAPSNVVRQLEGFVLVTPEVTR